jgi:hypothetical protein
MKLSRFVSAAAALAFSAGLVHATDISGPITSTIVITKNSQLVGDATCNVTGGPCIQFNAPNIKLNLNGHVLALTSCVPVCPLAGIATLAVTGEDGIDTNLQNGVMIEGPGLVRGFPDRGILISGNASGIYHVTVESSSEEGIRVLGQGNFVEDNTVVRSSLNGGFWAGIYCGGTGGHLLRGNEVVASGPASASGGGAGTADASVFGGIGINVASNGNVIDTNNVSGNQGVGIGVGVVVSGPTAGIDTGGSTNTTGNTIRNNSVFGNFVGMGFVAGFDIFDNNLVGSNSYSNNGCQTSGGVDAPTCPNVPTVAGHAIPVP